MKQPEIIRGLLFPPREDAAEAVHPTVCPFHHPPASLEASLPLDRLGFFASGLDVGGISKLLHQVAYRIVIVPFVQANALRMLPCRPRTANRDALEGGFHQLAVVPVRAVNCQTDRYAGGFRQDTSLDAVFGPIRGIGADFFPRPAEPWLWLRPSTARTSRFLCIHRTLAARPPRVSGRLRPPPIPGTGHGRYCSDRSRSRSTHSIGNPSAGQRRSHPCTCGRRPEAARHRSDACSHAWAARVRSAPTVHRKLNTDCCSSLISFRGHHDPQRYIGRSRVIRIGSYTQRIDAGRV